MKAHAGRVPNVGLTGLLVLLALCLDCSAANHWPQFRGPSGNGSASARAVPLYWSESSNIVWKVSVPGRGRSSPVIEEDRIWLTSALETGVKRTRIGPDDMQTAERVVLKAVCLDLGSGSVRWETNVFEVANPDPVHWLNSWATPTPVVEEGRLYCDFGTFGTVCLDADNGNVIWKASLPLDHQVGPGSSPVLRGECLILVRDGRDAQYLAALDKRTGKTTWKTDRPPIAAGSGNLKKSFVTPLLIEVGGKSQLLSPGAHWVAGYDPETGKEVWRARHGEGFSIGSCPVATKDLMVFSTGCFKAQFVAVRLGGEGDVSASHVLWKSLRQVPVMSSPVLVGEEIYYVSDDGMLTCADFRTGVPRWQERTGGSYLASSLAAEGRIYFFSQDGTTWVVEAATRFERLAENRLEGTVIATPAMIDSAIIIRSDTALYRIGRL